MAANSTPTTTGQMKLKLMVDTKGQKVIFAEAGKDFVDFLFHISYLPLGTVMKFLSSKGGLGNIYKSIEEYGDRISSKSKDDILKPKIVTISGIDHTDPQSLPMIQTSTSPYFQFCKCVQFDLKFFRSCSCHTCYGYSNSCKFVGAQSTGTSSNEAGYVKSSGTYMVMDDLLVRPKADVCIVSLLKSFDVKNIASVEAREVFLGKEEALKLLKASMDSQTVLTDVFLRDEDSKVLTSNSK